MIRAEPDDYMQRTTRFTVQKIDITKFLWRQLGIIAPQLFGNGGDRPPSPPWSWRPLWPSLICRSSPVAVMDLAVTYGHVAIMVYGCHRHSSHAINQRQSTSQSVNRSNDHTATESKSQSTILFNKVLWYPTPLV